MKMYGRKRVVEEGEFVEGLIVEIRQGESLEVVARNYFKENGEMQVEDEMYKIDFIKVMDKDTPCKQVKELEEQLGTKDFYVSEEVVDLLKG